MKSAKLSGSAKISQSSEIDVGGNIHELLTRASDAIRQDEIDDELGQHVMQLTTIIADSVRQLPRDPRISH
jgi:hypothetical protein